MHYLFWESKLIIIKASGLKIHMKDKEHDNQIEHTQGNVRQV